MNQAKSRRDMLIGGKEFVIERLARSDTMIEELTQTIS
jgi:hypothetical protein